MKCPHCAIDIHSNSRIVKIGSDIDGHWAINSIDCSACERMFLELISAYSIDRSHTGGFVITAERSRKLIYPALMVRPEPNKVVPAKYRDDFIEACLVIGISPKASAALSRRCLQALLRDNANIKKGSLEKEIQQVIDSKQLPSYISQAIDAIRNIGNFAAHPLKCNSTGEIIEVEVGEAEWNLEVLEFLFDFYFVQPALLKEKQDELNKKLASMGKPPMKKGI